MYSRFPARARLPRRGYLIPFIALSLDGVFRGCFALGFSPLIVRFISFQGNCKRFKTFHFNPEEAALLRVSVTWCDWKGKPQGVVTPVPSVQMVSSLMAKASPSLLSFRNPDAFVAGELHRHVDKWQEILAQHPKQDEILSYIKYKVNVKDFFTRFRGDFQEHFTILLARQEQSSAITNRVLALRILFLLQSWNVLKTDLSQSGEGLVKTIPLILLCH